MPMLQALLQRHDFHSSKQYLELATFGIAILSALLRQGVFSKFPSLDFQHIGLLQLYRSISAKATRT